MGTDNLTCCICNSIEYWNDMYFCKGCNEVELCENCACYSNHLKDDERTDEDERNYMLCCNKCCKEEHSNDVYFNNNGLDKIIQLIKDHKKKNKKVIKISEIEKLF